VEKERELVALPVELRRCRTWPRDGPEVEALREKRSACGEEKIAANHDSWLLIGGWWLVTGN
jgi:hypothetical protein